MKNSKSINETKFENATNSSAHFQHSISMVSKTAVKRIKWLYYPYISAAGNQDNRYGWKGANSDFSISI